jgi:hypothetical protein
LEYFLKTNLLNIKKIGRFGWHKPLLVVTEIMLFCPKNKQAKRKNVFNKQT